MGPYRIVTKWFWGSLKKNILHQELTSLDTQLVLSKLKKKKKNP